MKLNAAIQIIRNNMSTSKVTTNPLKAILRKEVDERLAAMTQEDRDAQTEIITQKIFNHQKYKDSKRISLFLSMPAEVDTSLLINDILSRGDKPFVPQYSRGQMKMLRLIEGDIESMACTKWGIKQHAADVEREDALETGGLDLVIAPGAAFTKKGHRLGHGGGYYDRYLTLLKDKHKEDPNFRNPYVLAVAYKQQIYDEIPTDSYDVLVDEVVTAD